MPAIANKESKNGNIAKSNKCRFDPPYVDKNRYVIVLNQERAE